MVTLTYSVHKKPEYDLRQTIEVDLPNMSKIRTPLTYCARLRQGCRGGCMYQESARYYKTSQAAFAANKYKVLEPRSVLA